jgi:uncharacterized protein (DUF342 family)
MFVFYPYENKENQELMNYLKNHMSEEVYVMQKPDEITSVLDRKKEMPSAVILFVREIAEAAEMLEKLHTIIEAYHQMMYFIAIAESGLENQKEFFNNNFEAFFRKPVEQEAVLKEVKKGISFIQNLNQQMNQDTSFLEEVSEVIGEEEDKRSFLFDTEMFKIPSILHQLKTEKDPQKKKDFYQKLKSNAIWPGKVLIRNVGNRGLYFDEQYFELDRENNLLKSKSLGFVQFKYSQLELIPAVEISEDFMHAYAFIFPFEGKEFKEALDLFFQGLQSLKVTKGIDYDRINEVFRECLYESKIEYIEVATGKSAENGYKEYIELLKKKETRVGKIIDESGTIDYREHSDIVNVKEGEPIARLIPEKPAVEGFAVTGQSLSASYESFYAYEMGENITLDEKENVYRGDVDGMLVFEGKTVHLRETLVIKGDVSLKTGHIHSNKNVYIHGNVEADMYIEAKGNIVIKGIVEDSKIVAGGSISAHGFTGSGKTWIFSKGDVNVDFCQNSHIEALGNVIFKKFSVNCVILTTKKVAGLENSRIIGGEVQAAQGCQFFTVGNEKEVPLKITLGVNFYNDKIVSRLLDRIDALKKEKAQIADILRDYLDLNTPLEPQLKKLHRKDAVSLIKRINQLKQKHLLIKKLEKTFKELTGEFKEEFGSRLKVRNQIFPGNELTIAGVTKKFNQKYSASDFRFSPSDAEIIQETMA